MYYEATLYGTFCMLLSRYI